MNKRILTSGIILTCALSMRCLAQTYNANSAFVANELGANETNSVFLPFSAGHSLAGTFTAFVPGEHTNAFAGNANTQGFITNNNISVPVSLVNVSTEPFSGFSGLDAGEILLHPGGRGPDGFAAPYSDGTIRFSAPAAGFYSIEGNFRSLDLGNTQNTIRQNGSQRVSINDAGPFTFGLQLAAGDNVDFSVGAGGGGIASDSTGLRAALTATAPPVFVPTRKVNIDFNGANTEDPSDAGTFVGPGAAGGGSTFNGVAVGAFGPSGFPVSASGLTDSNGVPTTVGFTINPVGGDNNPGATPPSSASSLFDDYLYIGDVGPTPRTADFTISGLGAAATADLYFYFPYLPASVVMGFEAPDTFVENGAGIFTSANTIFFNDVPVTDGSIVGTINGNPGVLSGLTIDAVPEPGTASLLGVIASAALLRRRRRA